ncbi:MAG: ribosome maturation factor RimM [Oscillospiraceae bacterium]|nr:ribosome maturation factor RimM [Oscillospiraceae bacterium]
MPKNVYLEAGRIVGTHGVHGELRVQPWCDSAALFTTLKTLYWDQNGEQPVSVRSRTHKNLALVKIPGVTTVQAAAALRDKMLYLHRDDLKLPEGSHFICDLIGMTVFDADSGEEYGTLTDVSATGANDVYHLLMGAREVLIPAIPPVIIETDIENGIMRIRPIRGMLE